jgi:hypothetical protein
MNATINFGWWLLPAAITIALLWWASLNKSPPDRWGMNHFFDAVLYLLALIPSLIAWLIWAVLT